MEFGLLPSGFCMDFFQFSQLSGLSVAKVETHHRRKTKNGLLNFFFEKL